MLTGEEIGAGTALRWGLVDEAEGLDAATVQGSRMVDGVPHG